MDILPNDVQSLRDSLHIFPISQLVQDEVTRELWAEPGENGTHRLSQTYFDFYAKRVQLHLLNGGPFCLHDHLDIVRICKMIISGVSRDEMRQKLSVQTNDHGTLEDAIDLCASLLVMTEIEVPRSDGKTKRYGISGRTPILWKPLPSNPLWPVISSHRRNSPPTIKSWAGYSPPETSTKLAASRSNGLPTSRTTCAWWMMIEGYLYSVARTLCSSKTGKPQCPYPDSTFSFPRGEIVNTNSHWHLSVSQPAFCPKRS